MLLVDLFKNISYLKFIRQTLLNICKYAYNEQLLIFPNILQLKNLFARRY